MITSTINQISKTHKFVTKTSVSDARRYGYMTSDYTLFVENPFTGELIAAELNDSGRFTCLNNDTPVKSHRTVFVYEAR